MKTRLDMWTSFDTDEEICPTIVANLAHGYPSNFLIDHRKSNNNYCNFGFNSCQFIWQEKVCEDCDCGDGYQEIYPKNFKFPMVRKILPVECERLMGYPDNYTLLWMNKGEPYVVSDSRRYKMLGNSIPPVLIIPILENLRKIF